MKRALLVLLATACALSACDMLSGDFRLSGTVDVATRLRDRTPRQGEMLFVVAKNAGGVPIAVLRIVNPEFPATFDFGTTDLLVPAVRRREPLTIYALLSTRGDLGDARPGDLEGTSPGVVLPGAAGVSVVLDRVR